MPREGFNRQLRSLQEHVLTLGSMASQAVDRSLAALEQRHASMAEAVIANDRQVDDLALSIEEEALLLIATQQPLASDLRIIAAVLAIVGELERIGDYAEGIAKLTLLNLDEPPLESVPELTTMSALAQEMLRQGLDAFINHDGMAARAIWRQDDAIDTLQDRLFNELVVRMQADPATVTRGVRLLWVTHNLERIADRVTNICERTCIMVSADRTMLRQLGAAAKD